MSENLLIIKIHLNPLAGILRSYACHCRSQSTRKSRGGRGTQKKGELLHHSLTKMQVGCVPKTKVSVETASDA